MQNDEEKEKALLSEWAAKADIAGGFIGDGAFAWPRLLKAKPRICFVLLEAYDNTPLDKYKDLALYKKWNLQEKRREEGIKGPTNATLARWAYGLIHFDENSDWKTVCNQTWGQEERKDAFGSTAQINLRKTPFSRAATSLRDLRTYVEMNWNGWLKDMLYRQWSLYRPDITICGGGGGLPFWCMSTALEDNESQKQTAKSGTARNGVKYWIRSNGQILLDSKHPAARGRAQEKYARVIDAVKEILADRER